MRIAVGQFAAGMDKAANFERIEDLTEQAAGLGAGLLVLPEGAMCDFGRPSDDLQPAAETLKGQFVGRLATLAGRHGVALVAGMFELIPESPLLYNTAVVVEPRRGLVGWYRKRMLFDALGDRESDRFQAGTEEPPILEVGGFKVGLAICYELRFPRLFEQLADRGADLVALPSAWVAGPLKEHHWSVLAHARAIDNTLYMAGSGQTGGRYAGRSLVVDPFGATLAGLGEVQGVTTAELSHERLLDVRARLPLVARRLGAPGAAQPSPEQRTAR
jgi:predicted amidohydrolase